MFGRFESALDGARGFRFRFAAHDVGCLVYGRGPRPHADDVGSVVHGREASPVEAWEYLPELAGGPPGL